MPRWLAALALSVALLATIRPAHGLSTSNVILGPNGVPLTFKGCNWFGFNNGATMVGRQHAAGMAFTGLLTAPTKVAS